MILTSVVAGDQDGLMVSTLKSGVAGVTGGLALLLHLDLGVAAIPTGAGAGKRFFGSSGLCCCCSKLWWPLLLYDTLSYVFNFYTFNIFYVFDFMKNLQ